MESIEQKLMNCHDTRCNISLEPGQYKDVTIEDIIAIIQLSHNRFISGNDTSIVNTDDFDVIDPEDSGLTTITENVELPHILVTLFITCIPTKINHITCRRVIGFDSHILHYPIQDKERFLELAIQSGVIDYDITRHIIGAFDMQYRPNTELGTRYLREHLRMDSVKSARST